MGSGIAEVALTSGFQVLIRDVSTEAVEKGRSRIVSDFDRRIQKEKMTAPEKEAILKRLSTTLKLEDFGNCDFVIEAAVENIPLKWIFSGSSTKSRGMKPFLQAILLRSPSPGSLLSPRGPIA